MAIHDRAYTRAKTWTKALRKYHIDRDNSAGRWGPWYNNLHQYADNKIHCSCHICACKTNSKHGRGNDWDSGKNWPIRDRRKIDEMEGQLNED